MPNDLRECSSAESAVSCTLHRVRARRYSIAANTRTHSESIGSSQRDDALVTGLHRILACISWGANQVKPLRYANIMFCVYNSCNTITIVS